MIKVLTTSHEVLRALRDAMRRYQCFRWSVAWASSGFPLFDELLAKRNRVSQLVVGTHFYQTHPDFLEVFVGDPKVHVVLQPSGVFHPKVYLFENSRDDWACVIGSPNFTGAAFSSNAEVAAYFDSAASGPNVDYVRSSSGDRRALGQRRTAHQGVTRPLPVDLEPQETSTRSARWVLWRKRRQADCFSRIIETYLVAVCQPSQERAGSYTQQAY